MSNTFDLDELRRASNLAGLPNWAVKIIDEAVEELSGNTLPAPLFTRTVYSVADLHAQIDAIEALGFTNYVIGRHVEHRIRRDIFLSKDVNDDRGMWIIKVYGETTE